MNIPAPGAGKDKGEPKQTGTVTKERAKPRDIVETEGLPYLEMLSASLALPTGVEESAKCICQRCASLVNNWPVQKIAQAALYAACMHEGIFGMLNSIVIASGVPEDDEQAFFNAEQQAEAAYIAILDHDPLLHGSPKDPLSYVANHVKKLYLSEKVQHMAMRIIEGVEKQDECHQMLQVPDLLSVAAVCFAARRNGERVIEKNVARMMHVAEIEISSSCEMLHDVFWKVITQESWREARHAAGTADQQESDAKAVQGNKNEKRALRDGEFERLHAALGLPDSVMEKAQEIYAKYLARTKSASMEELVSTAVYASCKRMGMVGMLDKVAEASNTEKEKIEEAYKSIMQWDSRDSPFRWYFKPWCDIVDYYVNTLNHSEQVQRLALQVIRESVGRHHKSFKKGGRDNRVLYAAAAVHTAADAKKEHKAWGELRKVGVNPNMAKKQTDMVNYAYDILEKGERACDKDGPIIIAPENGSAQEQKKERNVKQGNTLGVGGAIGGASPPYKTAGTKDHADPAQNIKPVVVKSQEKTVAEPEGTLLDVCDLGSLFGSDACQEDVFRVVRVKTDDGTYYITNLPKVMDNLSDFRIIETQGQREVVGTHILRKETKHAILKVNDKLQYYTVGFTQYHQKQPMEGGKILEITGYTASAFVGEAVIVQPQAQPALAEEDKTAQAAIHTPLNIRKDAGEPQVQESMDSKGEQDQGNEEVETSEVAETDKPAESDLLQDGTAGLEEPSDVPQDAPVNTDPELMRLAEKHLSDTVKSLKKRLDSAGLYLSDAVRSVKDLIAQGVMKPEEVDTFTERIVGITLDKVKGKDKDASEKKS